MLNFEELLFWKSVAVGLTLVLAFTLERWRPMVDSPLLLRIGHATRAAWQRLMKNASLFGFNALLSPLLVVPITAWAEGFSLGLRPSWWSGPPGLLLDLLLLDFWIYWWHRANHEIPLLWRFHEVHHLDELLDSTSAFRFHFGEVLLSACVRAIVIILFDIPLEAVIIFEALVLVNAIFHHSDMQLPLWLDRFLARLIITPGIHWVHHHALRADTDSNYGTILSLWDRLFGTMSATRRSLTMPIGVEGRRDRGLFGLLTGPFRRQGR
ncbi:MAG: sterol desaturase family protein [Geminicoccaceae bacterium]